MGNACDASKSGYLSSGSSLLDSLAACSQSCQSSAQCKSVTFWSSSKWCSHFSKTCDNFVTDSGANSVTFKSANQPTTTASSDAVTISGKACDAAKSGYLSSGSGLLD